MIVAARVVAVALAVLTCAADASAADEITDKKQQIAEFIDLHDLAISVSIGNYYLKQESLLAIRSLLARLGREDNLGPDWNPRNPQWQRAEEILLQEFKSGHG
jgi:hypothetical protein